MRILTAHAILVATANLVPRGRVPFGQQTRGLWGRDCATACYVMHERVRKRKKSIYIKGWYPLR